MKQTGDALSQNSLTLSPVPGHVSSVVRGRDELNYLFKFRIFFVLHLWFGVQINAETPHVKELPIQTTHHCTDQHTRALRDVCIARG